MNILTSTNNIESSIEFALYLRSSHHDGAVCERNVCVLGGRSRAEAEGMLSMFYQIGCAQEEKCGHEYYSVSFGQNYSIHRLENHKVS